MADASSVPRDGAKLSEAVGFRCSLPEVVGDALLYVQDESGNRLHFRLDEVGNPVPCPAEDPRAVWFLSSDSPEGQRMMEALSERRGYVKNVELCEPN